MHKTMNADVQALSGECGFHMMLMVANINVLRHPVVTDSL